MKFALATALKTASAVAAMVVAMTAGCDDPSALVAREAADRQAEQNRTMADLQREVAAGSRQLVEEQGAARAETLKIQSDLQSERARIADGWNDLEVERQQIAQMRQTDSFWAAILPAGGGVAAAMLALAFAWLVLFGLRRCDDSAEVACQLLVEQFLAPDGAGQSIDLTQFPTARSSAEKRIAGLLGESSALENSDPPTSQENS